MQVERLIRKQIMYGDDPNAFKALWRLTKGNKKEAFKIIRATVARYTDQDVTDCEIENALSGCNGGCEVEWASQRSKE